MVACNKNQHAVKKLDGDWIATKYQISDATTSVDLINNYKEVMFTFNKCKLKDNDFCSAIVTLVELDGSISSDADLFIVKEKGTILQLGTSSNGANDWTVEDLTKSNLIISKIDGAEKTKLEFTKK